MEFKKSEELLKKALEVTPLGAQTFSKSHRYFIEGAAPSFIDHARGCRVTDVDGNEFIDFICSLGPITVGYNDMRVNEAIKRQLKKGIIFSQASPISVELAEVLCEIVPCAEQVRFVKNGSDATSAAVRLARAYTGKDLVLCSGYHGMQNWYIASTTNNKGIPESISKLVQSFVYNDIEALEELIKNNENKVACVILEPIQADGPAKGYLNELRDLTEKYGIVLIFDEVVSGFRYALGGASERYRVIPDMAAFGKGMANGMPISAVAGKREIMEQIETKGVFISTTFGGETLSMAAALETIKILREKDAYKHFWKLGQMTLDAFASLIKEFDLGDVLKTSGLAPHCGLTFEGKGNLNYLDIQTVYLQRLSVEGILSIGINNFNLAHTEKEIRDLIDASKLAFSDVKLALEQDSLEGILMGGKYDPIFKRNID
jgi:glutamate-1-semialdehyde aminotransferase